jgi:hypothetical protein
MYCIFKVIFKVVVSIISIMVYTMVLSISWKYVASLRTVPNPWCSKCVATYNLNYSPLNLSKKYKHYTLIP